MIAKHLDLQNIAALNHGTALILGTFDGVHIGHRLLIEEGKKRQKNVAVLLIYTNKKMTKDHQKSGVLTSLEDRVNMFKELGVKTIYLLNLGDDLLKLSPREFVNNVLIPLAPAEVVVGNDFRFGKDAKGSSTDLASFGKDYFMTTDVDPLLYNSDKVSTSLIKDYLLNGDPKTAKFLLGTYYKLTGLVTKGYGLGNKLGFPTANMALDPTYFLPKHGVYFVRVKIKNKVYFGMASLGFHPTVNEVKVPLLEVNIFNFNDRIYHETLCVEFIDFLRPEIKFQNVKDLVTQLNKDHSVCMAKIEEGDY